MASECGDPMVESEIIDITEMGKDFVLVRGTLKHGMMGKDITLWFVYTGPQYSKCR